MKMRRYCFNVLIDLMSRNLIEIKFIGKQPVFCFDALKPSFCKERKFNMYVGQNTTLKYFGVRDVVSFVRDGNIITFNSKEIVEELANDVG